MPERFRRDRFRRQVLFGEGCFSPADIIAMSQDVFATDWLESERRQAGR